MLSDLDQIGIPLEGAEITEAQIQGTEQFIAGTFQFAAQCQAAGEIESYVWVLRTQGKQALVHGQAILGAPAECVVIPEQLQGFYIGRIPLGQPFQKANLDIEIPGFPSAEFRLSLAGHETHPSSKSHLIRQDAPLKQEKGFAVAIAPRIIRKSNRASTRPCMNEWNIQSRSAVCGVTGRAFADHEPCHTVLLAASQHGFERMDLSLEAWQTHGAEILARPNLISHWRGEYEAPPPLPPEPIKKDDAESLLRKLMSLQDDQYAPVCYILAVMLERKRLLKVKGQTRENGRRIFVYEHPRSGDVFSISDPDLQLDQLAAVQHQVADLLAHGIVEPVPVEEPFNAPSVVPTLAGA